LKVNVRVGGGRNRVSQSLGNLGERLEVNLQEELRRGLSELRAINDLEDADGTGRMEEFNSGRLKELVHHSLRAAISRIKTD